MYQTFIGLEIHIHLLTETKAFCRCASIYGSPPNTHICPICLGYPGVLPAVNREALSMAYLVARSLSCELARTCCFDRKNYFYPDMAKNYQITQFHKPTGRNGWMNIQLHNEPRRIRIHDVHLEEDAGKMIHAETQSLIDYNRAGTSLLEIVTEPDLTSGEEAEAFVREFRRMVRHLRVCDGNMEEGSLRCDANVSINLPGAGLGTKTEIKNLNSARFVRKALEYEIIRQSRVLDKKDRVIQETRLWDADRSVTVSMRSKESAHDYRYFPEPDMPPFSPDAVFMKEVEDRMVELPINRRLRYEVENGIPPDTADFLVEEWSTADFFDRCVQLGAPPRTLANWLCGTVQAQLKRANLSIETSPLTPERLIDTIRRVDNGSLSVSASREVLETVLLENREPADIISEKGLEQIVDTDEIDGWIASVIADNEKAVSDIRNGNTKILSFLMGQVMKLSGGKADAKQVRKQLEDALSLDTDPII